MLDCWGEDNFCVDRCCENGEGGCEKRIEVARGGVEESVKEGFPGRADEEECFGDGVVEFWIWVRIWSGWRCI